MSHMNKIKSIFHWILEGPFSARQQAKIHERTDYQKLDFVEYFIEHRDVSSAVWDKLINEACIEGFKPKPEDDVSAIFGLADEGLDDLVVSIFSECDKEVPNPNELLGMKPVIKVEDLVLFVSGYRSIKGVR